MSENQQSNPYEREGKWYWYDETFQDSKPYDSYTEAWEDLSSYIVWLNGGGPR